MDPTGNSCKSKGEVLADNKTDVTPNPKDKGIENYSNTSQNRPDTPSVDTPLTHGTSQPEGRATANSIYEQLNPDGTVKSRAFYDENGNQFCRQDYDHPHYDKNTQQYHQPHEHNYLYDENGFRNGKFDNQLPRGYTNTQTEWGGR